MACIGGSNATIDPSNLIQPDCANGNYGYITHTNASSFGNGPYYYLWLKNGILLNTGPLPVGDSVTHGFIPNIDYRLIVVDASTGCISDGIIGNVPPDVACPVPTEELPDPNFCVGGTDFEIFPTSAEFPSCSNNNIGFVTHSNLQSGTGVVPFYIVIRNGVGFDYGQIPQGSSITHDLIPGNTYQFIFVDPVSNCKSVGNEDTIVAEICCEVDPIDKIENFNCQ